MTPNSRYAYQPLLGKYIPMFRACPHPYDKRIIIYFSDGLSCSKSETQISISNTYLLVPNM